jgi:biopolymer transport protein ExbB/TolQ
MVEPIFLIAARVLAWAVLLCCLAAAVVIVDRLFILGRRRVAVAQLAARLRTVLRRGEPSELESFCGQKRSPVVNTLRRFAGLWRNSQVLRPVLFERAAGEELHSMERRLPALAALAGVTPMLGILSLLTVYGGLPVGTPDRTVSVAGPLDPAVIATVALLTGVIALSTYNLFVVRVRSHMRDIDRLGWDLLPHLDEVAGSNGSGGVQKREVPVFDDDEFFRKKV